MKFEDNAHELAYKFMREINPGLAKKYSEIIKFLSLNPTAASKMRGRSAPAIGTSEYIRQQAVIFSESRTPRSPKAPSTVPDEMVSVILVSYFDICPADISRIQKEHLLSMGAENMVGDLLERYLANILEPLGWIWCSGSTVKAVDFIKPAEAEKGTYRLLQVKNRDNSENSSSSAIRLGTSIEKWHRTFSRKTVTNWDKFPDDALREKLSEDGFKSFVRDYLRDL